MLTIINDHNLIEQCLQKNRAAQRMLYEKYFPKMIAVCMRYLKNEDDATAVLNNVFLKVFEKLKQFKAEGTLESWIRRIVINSTLNFIQDNKQYKNNFVLTSEFPVYGSPDELDWPDEGHLPETAWELTQEQLFEMVKELPSATRVVFNLHVIDGFQHKQIARQLKISEGTSKWHLSNARKLLKEKIKQAISSLNKDFNDRKQTF